MAWIVASVPFWLLGGVSMLGAIAWAIDTTETASDRARNFIKASIGAGLLFILAAWISS